MSPRLAPPGMELSQRLLGSVSYSDRLPVGRLLPHMGIIPGDVRSLRELHLVLTPDDRSLPGVNFNALVEWVGRVLGDGDLAEAAGMVSRDAGSYVEGCLKVYELVGLRLEQAREVVGPEIG